MKVSIDITGDLQVISREWERRPIMAESFHFSHVAVSQSAIIIVFANKLGRDPQHVFYRILCSKHNMRLGDFNSSQYPG
jgi:hypothetical protein